MQIEQKSTVISHITIEHEDSDDENEYTAELIEQQYRLVPFTDEDEDEDEVDKGHKTPKHIAVPRVTRHDEQRHCESLPSNYRVLYAQFQWILFGIANMLLIGAVRYVTLNSKPVALYLSWILEPPMLFFEKRVSTAYDSPDGTAFIPLSFLRSDRHRQHLRSLMIARVARTITIYLLCTFFLVFFATSDHQYVIWYSVVIPLLHAFRVKEAGCSMRDAMFWFPVMCMYSGAWRGLCYFAAWYGTIDSDSWWFSIVLILYLVSRHLVLYPLANGALGTIGSKTSSSATVSHSGENDTRSNKAHYAVIPVELTTAICTAYQRDIFWSTCFAVFAYVIERHVFDSVRVSTIGCVDAVLWLQLLALHWLDFTVSPQFIRVIVAVQLVELVCHAGRGHDNVLEMNDWLIYSRYVWSMLLLHTAWQIA